MGSTPGGAVTVTRKLDTAEALADELRAHGLLEPAQLKELDSLCRQCDRNVQRLSQELIQRRWLTPWQLGQVFAGRAAHLTFGPYLITDRLGEGGTGQVFKARHQRMRRLVALKLIRPDVLQDAEVVGRFQREMEVASRLSHPNVIHAYDAGTVGQVRFLALEFCEGIDLDKLLKQSGPLPVERACDFIRQGALGLQHASEHGLVHRDVKPSNFLLVQAQGKAEVPDYEESTPAIPSPGPTPWGLVKLLDLGLARLQRKVEGEKTRLLTTVGSVLGTADFLAPEQALDFHRADTRSDIYGLGCTFYFLLTGQAPFAGRSLAQKLMCHQQVPPPPLEQFRRDVPAVVRDTLLRMLAKKPEERYQAPAEVAGELAEFLGLHQLTARSPSAGRATAATLALKTTPTPRAASTLDKTLVLTGPIGPRLGKDRTATGKRRRLLWLPIVAGACLLALSFTVLLLTSGSQPRDTSGGNAALPKPYAFTPRTLLPGTIRTTASGKAVPVPAVDPNRVVILAQSIEGWRYLPAAEVAAVGRHSTTLDYDDAQWPIGKAPLGYGEKELDKRGGTIVEQHGVSYVFRRSFEMAADVLQRPQASFRLHVASDDVATVYLNGELADDDPSRGHEYRYWNRVVEVPAKLFRPGRNVLAALVKNSKGSSDIYWDAEISLENTPLPPAK